MNLSEKITEAGQSFARVVQVLSAPKDPISTVKRYAIAALCVAGALLLRWFLDPFLGQYLPLATIYAFVVIAVWYGGWGPAVFTTMASYFAANWFFIEPRFSFSFSPAEYWGAGLYIFNCLMLIGMSEGMRRAQLQAVRNAATALERQRALEAEVEEHKRAKERLRLAMASANMGAWDMDFRTGALVWDARQYEIFGKGHPLESRDEFYAMIHPSDVDRVKQATADCLLTGRVSEEFRIVRPDGAVRWVASRGATVHDELGRPVRIVGVNYDITDRKESQNRLETFAKELEHQVAARTMELVASQERLRALATELNLSEQRERKRVAGELHDYLAQMLALGRMKISQLRSKLISSSSAVTTTIAEVDDLFRDAIAFTRSLMDRLSLPVLDQSGLPGALAWLAKQTPLHGLSVDVRVSHDQVSLPDDQAMLLFQSVRELLINVAKHAATDRATVILRVDDDRLHIEVQDPGQGFDVAALEAKPAGEHFGLYSVRERMVAMGGWLAVKSALGQGTTITLALPLVHKPTSTPELRAPSSPHRLPREASASGISVLLVDDHVMVRQGLRTVLEGYPDLTLIGEAGDGEEAVSLAFMHRPSVIIMDINMPRLNGIEATARIKTQFPHIAVIGLSINTEFSNQEAMKKAGAAMLLPKEAAVDQLYQAIQSVLKTPVG